MEIKLCAICKSREANKTNSHIIPSFLVSMVASSDKSYKRNKEILYEICGAITKSYIGNEVSPDDVEKNFGELSDEELKDYKQTVVARDFIFCSYCEKKLGDLLESPYRNSLFENRKVETHIPYFFWLSVIWRMAKYDMIPTKLPTHIVSAMGKRLNSYIKARDLKEDLSYIMQNLPFDYSVVYCKDFCRSGSGFIYSDYDRKEKTLLLILGDVAIYVFLGKTNKFKLAKYYGLANVFSQAKTYKVLMKEQVYNVEFSCFENASERVVKIKQPFVIEEKKKMILDLWKLFKERHMSSLPQKPSIEFMSVVFSTIYSNEFKVGEKESPKHLAYAFAKGLSVVYGLKIQKGNNELI